MLQYVTLNKSFKCVSSYPCVKLAAQQLSIMETEGEKAPIPMKCFEVCMLQHLLNNSYKAKDF